MTPPSRKEPDRPGCSRRWCWADRGRCRNRRARKSSRCRRSPCKTGARSGVLPGDREAARGHGRITGEHDAHRRIDVALGLLSRAPRRDSSVHVRVREERLPTNAEVECEARTYLPRILGEQRHAVKPCIPVFSRALCKVAEFADQEIGERVGGERRRTPIESEASIRAEIVRNVVEAAPKLAAYGDLMCAPRPPKRVGELILIAQKTVRVARVQSAPIPGHGYVPLRLVIRVDVYAEVMKAFRRVDGDVVPVSAIEAE